MICPMLSALAPVDESGRPVDRLCIYENCRFFHAERRDCTLMMASRAMLDAASRPAIGAATAGGAGVTTTDLADMEKRFNEFGRGLLQSSMEMQGLIQQGAQHAAGKAQEVGDALGGLEQRLLAALHEFEERTAQGLQSYLADMRGALEAAIGRLQTRLEEQGRGVGATAAASAQALEHLQAITDMQQKIAERLLEEMSLVSAGARRLEQTLATVDKKSDKAADESLQISQQLMLVKGQSEKTHAALRGLHEGNRSVIQAVETQLQRDQADLARRRREEAEECNNRGVALYYRGALDPALQAFRRAIELQPDYAEAHNNCGLVLSKQGKEAEATASFQEALRVDPAMGEVYNNLGFLYHTTGKFDRAVQMFGQAIQNSADSSVAYVNLGNSFYKLNQADKAVEAWRRALELDPMNENARRSLRLFQQEPANN